MLPPHSEFDSEQTSHFKDPSPRHAKTTELACHCVAIMKICQSRCQKGSWFLEASNPSNPGMSYDVQTGILRKSDDSLLFPAIVFLFLFFSSFSPIVNLTGR
jgi:hypothetical protein